MSKPFMAGLPRERPCLPVVSGFSTAAGMVRRPPTPRTQGATRLAPGTRPLWEPARAGLCGLAVPSRQYLHAALPFRPRMVL